MMIETSLRPYPGTLQICKSRKEFYRQHTKLFGDRGEDLTYKCGRMVGKYDTEKRWPTYIVWAETQAHLAHEIAHVVLHVFEIADIDPRGCNGEPFCYLLSQLLLDADG